MIAPIGRGVKPLDIGAQLVGGTSRAGRPAGVETVVSLRQEGEAANGATVEGSKAGGRSDIGVSAGHSSIDRFSLLPPRDVQRRRHE